ASSSLVSRSSSTQNPARRGFVFSGPAALSCSPMQDTRPGGRVVMQRTANPRTPVQFRPRPPNLEAPLWRGFFLATDLHGGHAGGHGTHAATSRQARVAKLVDAWDLKSSGRK